MIVVKVNIRVRVKVSTSTSAIYPWLPGRVKDREEHVKRSILLIALALSSTVMWPAAVQLSSAIRRLCLYLFPNKYDILCVIL